jgi:hypothetical protein
MKNDRIQKIYDELDKYVITLASDPTEFGPRYLQDQIATCRNYINSVTQLMLEIHRDKHNFAHDLSAEEDVYAIESNDILDGDARVQKLPSIDDRKAAISVLLRERASRIAGLRRQIQDLDYVEKAVKHRHRELKDTMSEIKLQRSLLRDELDTGSFYGDERVNNTGLASDDDLNAEDIEKMLADPQETPTGVSPPEPPTVSVGIDEDSALQSFLEEGSEKKAPQESPAEDDFSDIFSRLDPPSGV